MHHGDLVSNARLFCEVRQVYEAERAEFSLPSNSSSDAGAREKDN